MAERASMTHRAVGASLWTVGTRLATKSIDLVMLVCLARFLGLAEFGLFAMAMAAVFIIEALFELPVASALIRAPELTRDMLHTAFTLSLLRGAVIGILLLVVAWPLAAFNDEPRLRALLAVLALAPVMRGLVSPRMVEYARILDFRQDAYIELTGKILAFAVSVGIAATTGSYWAIAAATVGGPLTTTLMSYVIAPLRIRITLVRWPYFSDLFGWNFLSQISASLNWQINRLLLPRLTTHAAFGKYAMGKQISKIPTQALIQPIFRPAMGALAADGGESRLRYLQLSNALGLVMVMAVGIPMLWSEVLVRVALGPSWERAAEWLRWISAITILGLPTILLAPLAMTLEIAIRTSVELLVRLPLVWLGAVHFGISGAIVGGALATTMGIIIGMWIVQKLAGIGLTLQATAVPRPVLLILPAGLILYLSAPWVLEAASVPLLLLRVVLPAAAYVATYVLSVWLAWSLTSRSAGLELHLFNALLRNLYRRKTADSSHVKAPAHSHQPILTNPPGEGHAKRSS